MWTKKLNFNSIKIASDCIDFEEESGGGGSSQITSNGTGHLHICLIQTKAKAINQSCKNCFNVLYDTIQPHMKVHYDVIIITGNNKQALKVHCLIKKDKGQYHFKLTTESRLHFKNSIKACFCAITQYEI